MAKEIAVALTEHELQQGIKKFASNINDQPLSLVSHRPDTSAKHTNCIANVLAKKEKYGGSICYGWYFLHRMSTEFGDYLISIHHAVWRNSSDLTLVDVTPFNPDEKHRPIAPNGDLLLLVDDNAQPICIEDTILPLPSRFHPLRSDSELENYITKLQREEYEFYNKEYGIVFK